MADSSSLQTGIAFFRLHAVYPNEQAIECLELGTYLRRLSCPEQSRKVSDEIQHMVPKTTIAHMDNHVSTKATMFQMQALSFLRKVCLFGTSASCVRTPTSPTYHIHRTG